MNNRTSEIIIGTTGEIQIDAAGFKGPDCEKATAFLEEALGVVGQKIKKPEEQARWRRGAGRRGRRAVTSTSPYPRNRSIINPTSKGKTMEKKTKTVQFQKEKDTKNTVKFAEVQTQGEAPIIGSLYVQKWFIGDATQPESHGGSAVNVEPSQNRQRRVLTCPPLPFPGTPETRSRVYSSALQVRGFSRLQP